MRAAPHSVTRVVIMDPTRNFLSLLKRWPTCVAAGPFLFVSGQMGLRTRDGRPCASYDDVRGLGPGPASDYAWVSGMEAPLGAQALALYDRYRKMLASQGADLG